MEEFTKQEALRLSTEQRKIAVKQGTPIPGTVEEFLGIFEKNLKENPLLMEFITREHSENHATLELMERQYERRINEQNIVIGNLKEEIANLASDLKEVNDNFNMYASKSLEEMRLKRERLTETCEAIERELSL